jgi:hypothetical protein
MAARVTHASGPLPAIGTDPHLILMKKNSPHHVDRPAVHAGLALLMLVATPALAADNPLLSPAPRSSSQLDMARPGQMTPLEEEKARMARDQLRPAIREREALEAQGKLPAADIPESRALAAEARRLDQLLQSAPPPITSPAATPPSTTPNDRQLNDTLRQPADTPPTPGTGYPPGRLGKGGATLKPGQKPPGQQPGENPAAGQSASPPASPQADPPAPERPASSGKSGNQ